MNNAAADKLINVGFFRNGAEVMLRVAGPEYLYSQVLDFFRTVSPTVKFAPVGRERSCYCYQVMDLAWNPWSLMKTDKAKLMHSIEVKPRFTLLEHGIRGAGSALAYFKMAVRDCEIPHVEMQIFDKKPEGFTVYFKPHDNPPKEHILKLVKCFRFRNSSTSPQAANQSLRSSPQRKPDNVLLYQEADEIVLSVTSGDAMAHPIHWPVIKTRIFTTIKRSWSFLGGEEPGYIERDGMTRKGFLYYLMYSG